MDFNDDIPCKNCVGTGKVVHDGFTMKCFVCRGKGAYSRDMFFKEQERLDWEKDRPNDYESIVI